MSFADYSDDFLAIASLPPAYQRLIEHLFELDQLKIIDKDGQLYVPSEALIHYIPPHL